MRDGISSKERVVMINYYEWKGLTYSKLKNVATYKQGAASSRTSIYVSSVGVSSVGGREFCKREHLTEKLAVAGDILTSVDRHMCCVDRQLYAVSGTPPRSRVCQSI